MVRMAKAAEDKGSGSGHDEGRANGGFGAAVVEED